MLAQEFHKPMIKKFKRRNVFARFKDNIWAADLVEMGSLSSKNHGVRYLLCVIDVITKYDWIKLLKDKKAKTVLQQFFGFTEIVKESKDQANKLWVDQGESFTIVLCKNGKTIMRL